MTGKTTKEEAIEKINHVKWAYAYESDYEAFDMATEALSTQTDGDLISRKKAIESFADMRDGYVQTTGSMLTDRQVINVLKALPSSDRPTHNGVYIENYAMPQCCDDCFALDDDGDYPMCRITNESRGYTFRTRERRMDKCPLVSADRPTGEWILVCDGGGECDNLYRCSHCGQEIGCEEYDKPKFCGECGADMRGERE